MSDEMNKLIKELVGKDELSDENIVPPIQIERFGTANNWERKSVLFAFFSGEMASALEFPAKDVEAIIKALQKSAFRAQEQ